MKIGYARVSSSGQNLEYQIDALKLVGCEKIFQEKKSATNTLDRQELFNAFDYCREGDIFYVTRLDRCSRSVKDLHQIIDTLNKKNVSFKATEQELDTSSSSGRLMIGLLSIVSAFETDLRAERQADGIASALKRGVKFGRSSKMDVSKIKEAIQMQLNGVTNQEISNSFKIGRSTLLRHIANYKKSNH